jgi:hypothetical protein
MKLKGVIYVLLTFFITIYVSVKEVDFFIFIHIIIILICCISLFSFRDMPFSMFKVYHIFNLFFMGVSPIIQHYSGVSFVGDVYFPVSIKIEVSLVVLLSIIIYNIYYIYIYKKGVRQNRFYFKFFNEFRVKNNEFNTFLCFIFLVLSLISFFLILKLKNFNFNELIFRGLIDDYQAKNSMSGNEKTSGLLIDKFFRSLSLAIFLASYYFNKKNKFLNIILFMLFLITCFPTGLARYNVGAFYIPILLSFTPILRRGHNFVFSLIGGLLIVFPFLNSFRWVSSDTKYEISLNLDMFNEMHFDAYITFVRVVYHDIITYGDQLLGVLFFYIPRSIWESKPLSSGQFHAHLIGLDFDNLAMVYLGEGYLNFGYLGVLLIVLFIASFSANLDKIFLKYKDENTFYNIVYLIIVSMFLFILRGDLANGVSYTIGTLIAMFFVHKLIKKFN